MRPKKNTNPGPPPDRRRGRVAGYGTARPAAPGARPPRRRTSPLVEGLVWLSATAVAGALLLLLARHDLMVALPVMVSYAGISWLLWRTRRR